MIVLVCLHASAQISHPSLRCTIPATRPGDFDDEIQPNSAQEAKQLAQSPHGAQRLSKHLLEVHWAGGVRRFHDEKPYEPLAGVRWFYCAYDPQTKMHLIGKDDSDVFTGVLLNDQTGELLPGGEEVSFSPNSALYLASEQPDGQDGPTLKVFRMDGQPVWKGYGRILESNGSGVAAELISVQWNAQNQTVMEVALPDGKHQLETLTREGDRWEWLPRIAEQTR
ncbi:MAG: hypothetical protein WA294_19040 [Acidobacteriaceae bacterium]